MQKNKFFPEIGGNFGFGCMRLPNTNGDIDYPLFCQMVDTFLDAGFNYFDTAHGYVNGKSEIAIRECIVKRHPREHFLLANKLTKTYFNSQEDILPLFEQQLQSCGTDYFDFYLMHAQNKNNYEHFKRCHAYETAFELKKQGRIRHLGLSFHDKADVLDCILTEHPEMEFVQIQLNYIDYEDETVESRKVYEICEKHKKPVFVMEPVKGGSLVNLPAEADAVFRALNGGSNAAYALRFAASFPSIAIVLSGMSDMAQMQDNISTMQDFTLLNTAELAAIEKVCAIFRSLHLIPCTSCRYCIEENKCPKNIRIPDMFSALNAHEAFHNWNTGWYYTNVLTENGHGKASECIRCGKCEKVCPQHLPIRELLKKVAATFERKPSFVLKMKQLVKRMLKCFLRQ